MYDVFDRALILMQQGNAAKQRSSEAASGISCDHAGSRFCLRERSTDRRTYSRLRKEHRITQLAERLGVSQQTIQAYESGKRRIQVAALPELAQLLLTTLEELLG